jgi:hypothetical protein
MTASILPPPRFVALDPGTGQPLVGGFVRTYVPSTLTPKLTWQDAVQTTPNTFPIVLDGAGSAVIYGVGSYDIAVTDALGNQTPGFSGVTFGGTAGIFVDGSGNTYLQNQSPSTTVGFISSTGTPLLYVDDVGNVHIPGNLFVNGGFSADHANITNGLGVDGNLQVTNPSATNTINGTVGFPGIIDAVAINVSGGIVMGPTAVLSAVGPGAIGINSPVNAVSLNVSGNVQIGGALNGAGGNLAINGNVNQNGNFGTNGAVSAALVHTNNFVSLAVWTTGTRPSSPVTGTFGYNSTTGATEVWTGSSWV